MAGSRLFVSLLILSESRLLTYCYVQRGKIHDCIAVCQVVDGSFGGCLRHVGWLTEHPNSC